MEAKITARIAELTKERDAFVLQASNQLSALNGAIRALSQLLEKDPAGAESAAAPESAKAE